MDQQTTHLTDFISAQVLEREGFIHSTNSEKMLEAIDKQYLAEQGWVRSDRLREVLISPTRAAGIAGVAPRTLLAYINSGHLRTVNGSVTLLDALAFDYSKAKEDYLKKKHR
jgi:hypothetical protein